MGVKAGAKAAGAAGAARGPRKAGGQRPPAGGLRAQARRAEAAAEARRPSRRFGAAAKTGSAAAKANGPLERGRARPAPRPFNPNADWQGAVRATVEGLRYELVDVERMPRGLLRVTIDRRPGQTYASPAAAVTVDDCEAVTRQLQYALEVDGVDYARLEVSSPGLDRPLMTAADYERFCGRPVHLTLKVPFQGRKHFQGLLGRAEGGWQVVFDDGKAAQALSFTLDEVREARLVPVVDFKGRKGRIDADAAPAAGSEEQAAAVAAGQANEVDGGTAR